MRRGRGRAERMRAVVDCLPYETKLAMLEGIERYEIIAGAYSDKGGGVCPMLAAHRCGGRTDFRTFARAWDRFTGAGRGRRASERELRTLSAHLESSVWHEDQQRAAASRTEQPRAPKQRTTAAGSAWLVPFRDLDEYRRALETALVEPTVRPTERPPAGRPAAPSSPPARCTPETVSAGT